MGPTIRCVFDPQALKFEVAIPGASPEAPLLGILDTSALHSVRPSNSAQPKGQRRSNRQRSGQLRLSRSRVKEAKERQLQRAGASEKEPVQLQRAGASKKEPVKLRPNVPKSAKGVEVLDAPQRYQLQLFDVKNKRLVQENSQGEYLRSKSSSGLLSNLLGWKALSTYESFVRNEDKSGVVWVEYHGDTKFAVFREIYVNLDYSVVILFDPRRDIWLQIVSLDKDSVQTSEEGEQHEEGVYSAVLWARSQTVNHKTEIPASAWTYLQVGRWVLA